MPSKADRVWSEFMTALDGLAPDTRAAFLLHEVFEASYDEIARLIGEPVDTCQAHVEYARAHALACMKPLNDKDKATPQ
ncbi:MAG TPA: sigma factor-like helix-turn-helix DNA-binding protein [Lysobacter sp.]